MTFCWSFYLFKRCQWFFAEIPESWRWCWGREVAAPGQTGEFGVNCSTVWDKDEKCPGSELVVSSASNSNSNNKINNSNNNNINNHDNNNILVSRLSFRAV